MVPTAADHETPTKAVITGDDVTVSILIDTLNNEFSNKQSKIYFYPQNETEFAQITGGIAIKSGMFSHLAINQIRKSIRDPKNCGTRELLKFKRYTKEKCVWEQKTNPIAAKCGCISDLAPDYLSYATEELSKMTSAEIYLNETNKFCSFVDILTCAPNSIVSAYDCPSNCVEVNYEVDMITSQISDKLIFSRLPLGFDENQVDSLEKLSEYGSFQAAPGYDQLNVVLEHLFEHHLRMMEMFWWKKDENPYYPTWFNNQADYGYGTRGSYFGLPPYVTSSIMPCFEDSFNPSLFDINPARLSLLITILEKYKSRYDYLHSNWTKSYKTEVYRPFKREIKHAIKKFRKNGNRTDSSLIEMTVLKKIYKQMILFSVCFGHAKCEYLEWRIEQASEYHYMLELEVYKDPSLSELWAPRWMLELEEVVNEGLSFSNTTKKMVNDLIGTKGSRNSSVWSKPLAIYLAWFMKDPRDENGVPDRYMPTIPHAFSLEAYKLDALIDTSYAIKNSSMVLKLVGLRLLRIVRAHKSAIFYEEVAKHAAFYEPLFHETEHAAINKTMLCLDHYYRVLDYRVIFTPVTSLQIAPSTAHSL
uniref:Uncharacterized protein n=1 Tax=Plectus sambesii TaxID=2011161 RepID=A0A914X5Q5_9BILA